MSKDYIPFYGSVIKDSFKIEREAMDKAGVVVDYLNRELSNGIILDVGAGNGFTANKLLTDKRNVVCMEPSEGMIDRNIKNVWVKGTAENMPFHENYFDGGYSTWAYFLTGVDKKPGLIEFERVVKHDSKIIIIDNEGDDEFCSFAKEKISSERDFYLENGFKHEILHSAFEFNNLEEAQKLMELFFGVDRMKDNIKLKYEYKIAAYSKIVNKILVEK